MAYLLFFFLVPCVPAIFYANENKLRIYMYDGDDDDDEGTRPTIGFLLVLSNIISVCNAVCRWSVSIFS